MPNFDKTGPAGQGPRTGQGQGNCSGNGGQGTPQKGLGGGRGCRMGNGCANISLDDQEKILEDRLKAIREAKNNN
jgi:hypothetical protein